MNRLLSGLLLAGAWSALAASILLLPAPWRLLGPLAWLGLGIALDVEHCRRSVEPPS